MPPVHHLNISVYCMPIIVYKMLISKIETFPYDTSEAEEGPSDILHHCAVFNESSNSTTSIMPQLLSVLPYTAICTRLTFLLHQWFVTLLERVAASLN